MVLANVNKFSSRSAGPPSSQRRAAPPSPDHSLLELAFDAIAAATRHTARPPSIVERVVVLVRAREARARRPRAAPDLHIPRRRRTRYVLFLTLEPSTPWLRLLDLPSSCAARAVFRRRSRRGPGLVLRRQTQATQRPSCFRAACVLPAPAAIECVYNTSTARPALVHASWQLTSCNKLSVLTLAPCSPGRTGHHSDEVVGC